MGGGLLGMLDFLVKRKLVVGALMAAGLLLLAPAGDSGRVSVFDGAAVWGDEYGAAAAAGRAALGWDNEEWSELRAARESDWKELTRLAAEFQAEQERLAAELDDGSGGDGEELAGGSDAVGELAAKREAALQQVYDHPGGVPVGPVELGPVADWFDWQDGLEFFADRPGDQTPALVRESVPESRYFYHEGYPAGIPNFADGSLGDLLAEELAREATAALPDLFTYDAALGRGFRPRLAWAVRPEQPGLWVNVWTRFQLQDGPIRRVYVVGGVMGFRLAGVPDAVEPEWALYPEPAGWVGPVVVERLF